MSDDDFVIGQVSLEDDGQMAIAELLPNGTWRFAGADVLALRLKLHSIRYDTREHGAWNGPYGHYFLNDLAERVGGSVWIAPTENPKLGVLLN